MAGILPMGDLRIDPRTLILLALPLFLSASVSSCSKRVDRDPVARNGVLDLRGISGPIADGRVVSLNGQWKLFWNTFLLPSAQIASAGSFESAPDVSVPGSWNRITGHGKVEGGQGYGTYSLRVILDQKALSHRILALYFGDCATAASVFVNGHHLKDRGLPGRDRRTSHPDERPFLAVIPDSIFTDRLDIQVHVSNFHHRKGGLFFPVQLGSLDAILKMVQLRRRRELLLMGALLIMALYHFFLYWIRPRETSNLIFSLFVTVVMLRGATTGEKLLMEVVPWLSFHSSIRIEFASFFFAAPVGLHFIQKIFPEDLRWKIVRFFYFIAGIASLSLFFSPSFFTRTALPYILVTLVAIFRGFAILVRAVLKKRDFGFLMLAGFTIMMATAINDVLNTLEVLTTGYSAHFGLLALVLSQSMILSIRFSRAFDEAESLSADLAKSKEDLEIRVQERTRELGLEMKERMQAQRKAEELAGAKSDFLASMSHEIRTPMNAILGMAELLDDTPLDSTQKEFVRIFRRAGASLMNILNDILDLSRLEAGQFSLDPRAFHLRENLEVVKKSFILGMAKKEIEFHFEIDPALPELVYGDPDRIVQVLTNLISNAFKFTREGRIDVRVVRDARGAPWVRFEVTDTGIGIDSLKTERLFERFYRVDSGLARRSGGAGLGLAISKELLDRMKGEIAVESFPGKGSHFYFLVALPEETTELLTEEGPGRIEFASARQLHILVVDDNDDNLFLVERFLERTPWKLSLAKTGEEALVLNRGLTFQLILLDIQMPDMDGFMVLDRLRSEDEERGRQRVPVIALTGQGTPEERERIQRAGFDGHLIKPVSRTLLIRSIFDAASRTADDHPG